MRYVPRGGEAPEKGIQIFPDERFGDRYGRIFDVMDGGHHGRHGFQQDGGLCIPFPERERPPHKRGVSAHRYCAHDFPGKL